MKRPLKAVALLFACVFATVATVVGRANAFASRQKRKRRLQAEAVAIEGLLGHSPAR
jgi:hypothetical protein